MCFYLDKTWSVPIFEYSFDQIKIKLYILQFLGNFIFILHDLTSKSEYLEWTFGCSFLNVMLFPCSHALLSLELQTLRWPLEISKLLKTFVYITWNLFPKYLLLSCLHISWTFACSEIVRISPVRSCAVFKKMY